MEAMWMSTGVSARDLFRLTSLSQPLAVAGQYFYVENRVDEAANGYRAQLNSVDDQGHQRVVATVGDLNVQPAVTATTVYFAAKVGDQPAQLTQQPLAGGKAETIATPGEAVNTVLAARDGQSLYFKTTETTEKPKLPNTEKFPVTRHVTRLINKADGYGWLPQRVTYRLRRFVPATGAVEEIFQQAYDFTLTSVSADGTLVTYLQDDQPANDRDFAHGAYCLNVQTGAITHVTASLAQGQFADATLSPDGTRVALVGNDGQFGSQTVSDLYIADLASGQLTDCTPDLAADLVPDLAGDFTQQVGGKLVKWLDNDQVAVLAAFHAHSQVYVGGLAGVHLVDDTAQQIVDFDVVTPDKLVLAVSRQTLPSALVTVTVADGQERLVYDPNAAYEQTHHFAQPQHFDYQAADGQALEGWYLPAQTTAPRTPVLLYVHGGPHANYGEAFFYEFQVHAALGYGVVFVNPRGSTSYGQDFENAVNGHYGEGDFTDVMSGLDYALAHFPELDADRQYIAGGSYGGFMTLWTIGHTHRFAAAVSQRSVTNWISLFGTSDIGFRFNPVELGSDLFDEGGLASYWKQSPLAYAPQVTTPVRLLHGEWDMRCPISQSEEYFTAVKRAGVDADFIRYPQSFHGVSRSGLPSLRLQRIADMDAWFTAHPTVQNND
ncbi:dipeptidyl aminopeptidase/acylaminoacyl-peptidase [Levilactobacillus spicheri]|uniref:Dipeptidyl aminopeptidase/acylaminoacyl-peptidase n=2 Tax=Levilactobacillus spicheri TaxID=216463 RepID=A0A0F3RV50_9LACO|nr:dipeptidyl aminopeptidase/acylaminoacyl-peptidase [Levilactobacillus spicheri]